MTFKENFQKLSVLVRQKPGCFIICQQKKTSNLWPLTILYHPADVTSNHEMHNMTLLINYFIRLLLTKCAAWRRLAFLKPI